MWIAYYRSSISNKTPHPFLFLFSHNLDRKDSGLALGTCDIQRNATLLSSILGDRARKINSSKTRVNGNVNSKCLQAFSHHKLKG